MVCCIYHKLYILYDESVLLGRVLPLASRPFREYDANLDFYPPDEASEYSSTSNGSCWSGDVSESASSDKTASSKPVSLKVLPGQQYLEKYFKRSHADLRNFLFLRPRTNTERRLNMKENHIPQIIAYDKLHRKHRSTHSTYKLQTKHTNNIVLPSAPPVNISSILYLLALRNKS
jgi:hypothetical protein